MGAASSSAGPESILGISPDPDISGQTPIRSRASPWPTCLPANRLETVTLEVELNGARALVTGGAGFVGSHIVEQLVAAGAARVLVVDDLTRGRRENLHSVSGNAA